ncbi:MAG: DUF484 family protein [Gammaproteobacteria bacterium]|nr:DUF484 family protein [Gammaproteobacteria bacterium]MDH5650456.1 DUF484 family protein [Gammaproteobacteria bacterium]
MTMKTQTKKKKIDVDMERDVANYLMHNPDFFTRHEDLLGQLSLSHASGKAISLIERQVAVLREQNTKLDRKLGKLIENARFNEQLVERINALILALLDARSLEHVLEIVETRLSRDFDADAVIIRLFNTGHPAMAAHPDVINWSEPALGAFEKIIAGRRPICGSLRPGQLDSLFNDEAGNIGSAALIPLIENDHSTTCYGMLAIGSHNHQRFRSDMGTLFLKQLGDIMARVLRLHLEKKEQ